MIVRSLLKYAEFVALIVPLTSNVYDGDVVPIPTLPVLDILTRDVRVLVTAPGVLVMMSILAEKAPSSEAIILVVALHDPGSYDDIVKLALEPALPPPYILISAPTPPLGPPATIKEPAVVPLLKRAVPLTSSLYAGVVVPIPTLLPTNMVAEVPKYNVVLLLLL
jgi:hypothetical protein